MTDPQQPPIAIVTASSAAKLGRHLTMLALNQHDGRQFRTATQYYLFEGGCVFGHHRKPDVADVLRWDQVAQYHHRTSMLIHDNVLRRTNYRFELQAVDGRRYEVAGVTQHRSLFPPSGLTNFDALVAPLVTAAQLPTTRQALSLGRSVDFRFFMVAPGALHYGPNLLPWDELARVHVRTGSVRFYRRGERLNWGRSAVGDIPNFGLMLALIEQLSGIPVSYDR